MKNKYIILMLSVMLCSCESYLDRQPDDMLTEESIWEKQTTTLRYLYNVYSWTPNDTDPSGQVMADHLSTDELTCAYPNRFYELVIHNTFAPLTGGDSYRTYPYTYMYRGIREATIFIKNVDRCPELSDDEKVLYKSEAQFLRAFYYYRLMKLFGPVIFSGDELVDFSSANIKNADRAPWQTIVDWVCEQLDEAASKLPDANAWGEAWQGRATRGAAMAVKARLLLYSARPLFNGQNGTHIYDNVKNKDGELLFNTTYDESRWRTAAQAAKAIIDLNEYALVDDSEKENDMERAMENLQNLYVQRLANTELIYTIQKGADAWKVVAIPTAIISGATSYGGVAPTQKIVDAFASANGYYPIKTDYFDTKEYAQGANVPESAIDSRSNYTEEGHKSMIHPLFAFVNPKYAQARETMNMYVGREPRFYRNIIWSNTQYVENITTGDVHLYAGGKSGPETSHNYSPTGYLPLKWIDSRQSHKDGWGAISWPVFRLGGVYLDYIEALNEYDPNNADILLYWNKLRHRAGVPDIDELYPEIKGNKELQRKYIQRERMVEMCFEQQRYYDTRTWMIASVSENGYVIGCNIKQKTDAMNSAFWTRVPIGDPTYGYGEGTVLGKHVFEDKNYLYPFNQEEIDRVPALNQSNNYGWTTK
ncbi:MAG: RagB/SusD family nutrient uptake outer membrane protein [Bacteroidales bacterium]|nr:RagB/SusD family nutrient uptake outer membrane protein [Bacteroidales bacterium]